MTGKTISSLGALWKKEVTDKLVQAGMLLYDGVRTKL